MSFVPAKLALIAHELRLGREAEEVAILSLLKWFGAERRGSHVVAVVRSALDQVGVYTEPDFESAFLEGSVSLKLKGRAGEAPIFSEVVEGASEALDPSRLESRPDGPHDSSAPEAFADPTYRIGKLAAANRVPVGVTPDCTVQEATTVMLALDYSQLPVWQNERTVKGIVTWTSIGSRLALGQPLKTVRDCMEPANEVSVDSSIFAAINTIVEHQYALVRGSDNRIVGIVTPSDLSLVFQQLSEPFLLLGEIENHVRRLIHGRFSVEDLNASRDPSDTTRQVSNVSDLTFGEYLRLLDNPTNWERLAIRLDRGAFTKELNKIRSIRNDVMHFDPDGIGEDDLTSLRRFVRFLQRLRNLGAT